MPILFVLLSTLPVDHCIKSKTITEIVKSYERREINLNTADKLIKIHCKKLLAE